MQSNCVPNQCLHAVLGGVVQRSVMVILIAIGLIRIKILAQVRSALAQPQRRVFVAPLQVFAQLARRATHTAALTPLRPEYKAQIVGYICMFGNLIRGLFCEFQSCKRGKNLRTLVSVISCFVCTEKYIFEAGNHAASC